MKPLIIPFIISLLLLGGCRTYKDPQMYHSFAPRALSVEADDTYVIRVQGKGLTRDDAVTNAQINALRDVIFKDIQVTFGDHKTLMRLINNPSAEQKHSEFFSGFFSEPANYGRFIVPEKKNREFFSSPNSKTVLLNVKVKRKELRDYLKDMGVL
ncbi:MAG: hypothetical protein K2K82_03875 [Muribaculaceae bacterium]|nr:hypothetical protein [Muribaculaceae bacterium]